MVRRDPLSARALSAEHWLLLFVLGIAGFFEGYDSFIFTVALPQIRDSFGLSQSGASLYLSLLFLGSLPAVLVTRYADIYGRRRLLVVSIIGYSLFTAVTAAAPTMGFFVGSQFVARLFLNAECALAWTMVAEELPARSRGFGFGWLTMSSAVGAAMGSALYGAVYAPLGVSWRALYVVALPPLAAVLFFRRRLSETKRYRTAEKTGRLAQSWNAILRPPHRRWIALVGTTDLLFGLAALADVFTIDFMQTDLGLSATESNLMVVVAGLLAIPFLLAAGALSDRYGRKLVGCSFGLLSVFGAVGFYLFAHGGIAMFVCLSLMLIGQFGAWPTLDAFYAELFPTGLRAFAGSSALLFRVPGEFLSMVFGAALIAPIGGLGRTAVILTMGPLAAVAIIWRFFPETHGRELEDINQDSPLALDPIALSAVTTMRRLRAA
jgi:putative MFS transporter